VAEIAALREEEARELPPLKAAEKQAERAVFEAREALKRAEADWRGKHSVRSGVAARLAGRISRCEAKLRQTASSAIGQFVSCCRASIEEALGSFSAVAMPTGRRSIETGRPEYRHENNAADIERTVRALEGVIEKAERLKMEAISDSAVEEQVQALAAALPAQARQQVLILDESREYALVISEWSAMVRQSQPWKDTKRAIRESLGIGSFRPRRR
jgi:hypothetical protein